jgi:hypothetical protein
MQNPTPMTLGNMRANGVRTRIRKSSLLISGILVLLAGCGPNETAKKEKRPPSADEMKLNEHLKMIGDQNRDDASYLQQLHSSLKVTDGMILVEDFFPSQIVALPVTSNWSVSCGIEGFYVAFGNAVSGSINDGNGGVENAAKITFSIALIDRERCKTLASLIAKDVQRTLSAQ